MGYVAIYARVSSIRQKRDETIDNQLMRAAEWLKRNEILEGGFRIFKDDGISGRKDEGKRSGLKDLIAEIEAGNIEKIWFFKQARLARESELSLRLYNLCKRNKVLFYFDDFGLVDTTKPISKFLFTIVSGASELEADNTLDYTKAGRKRKIDDGSFPHCSLFGWNKAGRNNDGLWIWKPNEKEQMIAREMFRLVLNGTTTMSAVRILFPHLSKKAFTNELSNWYKRFKRPEFAGYSYTTERELKPSKIYHKEVVSLEDWKRIQTITSNNNAIVSRNKILGKYSSTGVYTCHYCGMKYYPNYSIKNGNSYFYLIHHASIKIGAECHKQSILKGKEFTLFLNLYFVIGYVLRLYNKVIHEGIENDFIDKIRQSRLISVQSNDDFNDLENKMKAYKKTILDLNTKGIDTNDLLLEMGKIQKQIDEMDLKIQGNKQTEIAIYQSTLDYLKETNIEKLKEYFEGNESKKNLLLKQYYKRATILEKQGYLLTSLYQGFYFNRNNFTKDNFDKMAGYIEIVGSILKWKIGETEMMKRLWDETMKISKISCYEPPIEFRVVFPEQAKIYPIEVVYSVGNENEAKKKQIVSNTVSRFILKQKRF